MCSWLWKSRRWKLERQMRENGARAIPMPIRLLWRSPERNSMPTLSLSSDNSFKSVLSTILTKSTPFLIFILRFGRECYLDFDDQVTCSCPLGYAGRRCEQCSAGYSGNPLIQGQSCRPGTFLKLCPFQMSTFSFVFFIQIGAEVQSFKVRLRCCLNKKNVSYFFGCIQSFLLFFSETFLFSEHFKWLFSFFLWCF